MREVPFCYNLPHAVSAGTLVHDFGDKTMMQTIRSLKAVKFAPIVLLLAIISIAAAPAALPTPNAPTAAATSNAGEIVASWQSVAGAQFYTVGWINRNDYQQIGSSGDWLSAFHYATIPASRTSYTVNGLKAGEEYWTIIGARTTRVGGDSPTWSAWSGLVTTSGQHGAGFCPITGLPLPPEGYLSIGDAAKSDIGTFTLTGVANKATVQLGSNRVAPASGRQFITVCGRFQAAFEFTPTSGTFYQVDTDAGIGFAYFDEDTTRWGTVPEGESRTGCEIWIIPATATTAIVAVNPNLLGAIGESLHKGDVSLYRVDLP